MRWYKFRNYCNGHAYLFFKYPLELIASHPGKTCPHARTSPLRSYPPPLTRIWAFLNSAPGSTSEHRGTCTDRGSLRWRAVGCRDSPRSGRAGQTSWQKTGAADTLPAVPAAASTRQPPCQLNPNNDAWNGNFQTIASAL